MVRWKDGVRMKGLGLGREEPSFNHTRHSHSSGCDRIRHNRAPRANAQGPLGCDRYFSRNAIYSGRATLTLSLERIVATAVGASAGVLEANFFGATLVAFAVAIILIWLLAIAFRLEKRRIATPALPSPSSF